MFISYRHTVTVVGHERKRGEAPNTTVSLATLLAAGVRIGDTQPLRSGAGERVVLHSVRVYVDDAAYAPEKHQLQASLAGVAGQTATHSIGAVTQRTACADCAKRDEAVMPARCWWCDVCSARSSAPDALVLYASPLDDATLLRYASLAADGFASLDHVRSYKSDLVELRPQSVLAADCAALPELAERFARRLPPEPLGPARTERDAVVVPTPLFKYVADVVRNDALRNISVALPSDVEVVLHLVNAAGLRTELKVTVMVQLVSTRVRDLPIPAQARAGATEDV